MSSNGIFCTAPGGLISRCLLAGNHWNTNTGGGQIACAEWTIDTVKIQQGGGPLAHGIETNGGSTIRNCIIEDQQCFGVVFQQPYQGQVGNFNDMITASRITNSGVACPANGFPKVNLLVENKKFVIAENTFGGPAQDILFTNGAATSDGLVANNVNI